MVDHYVATKDVPMHDAMADRYVMTHSHASAT
jgi:hypothetical protein